MQIFQLLNKPYECIIIIVRQYYIITKCYIIGITKVWGFLPQNIIVYMGHLGSIGLAQSSPKYVFRSTYIQQSFLLTNLLTNAFRQTSLHYMANAPSFTAPLLFVLTSPFMPTIKTLACILFSVGDDLQFTHYGFHAKLEG